MFPSISWYSSYALLYIWHLITFSSLFRNLETFSKTSCIFWYLQVISAIQLHFKTYSGNFDIIQCFLTFHCNLHFSNIFLNILTFSTIFLYLENFLTFSCNLVTFSYVSNKFRRFPWYSEIFWHIFCIIRRNKFYLTFSSIFWHFWEFSGIWS